MSEVTKEEFGESQMEEYNLSSEQKSVLRQYAEGMTQKEIHQFAHDLLFGKITEVDIEKIVDAKKINFPPKIQDDDLYALFPITWPLSQLKLGKKLKRPHWGADTYIFMQPSPFFPHPVIYLHQNCDRIEPYFFNSGDLFANDWEVVD